MIVESLESDNPHPSQKIIHNPSRDYESINEFIDCQ